MRPLALLTFVSLDGVMQAPGMPDEDRSGGFARGGWATPWWDSVMAQVGRTAMAAPYDMLFGRQTYDLFAGFWPDAPASPAAARMNAARKYVATSDPGTLAWANSTALAGDIATAVAALKQTEGPLLQVHGSAQLIRTLLVHDLVDELRLWTFPLTLGDGKRLFAPDVPPRRFALTRSEATEDGVMMGFYCRDRGDDGDSGGGG